MAIRTTLAGVQAILPTGNQLTAAQINAAIAAATCVIDQVEAGCGSDLTDACLTQAEMYLAAHYAAVTDNTLSLRSEKSACGGSVTYGFEFGEGIKGTPFGQMANTLTGGCLAEQDKQPVGLFSIGSI